MIPNVVLLPGFGGSTLARQSDGTIVWGGSKTYVNGAHITGAVAILLHDLQDLALDASGNSQVPIVATSVTGGYYAVMEHWFGKFYNFLPIPYDWRLPLPSTATAVAAYLDSLGGTQPYYVVAHSMGCMLATLVWSKLRNPSRVRGWFLIGNAFAGSGSGLRAIFAAGDDVSSLMLGLQANRVYQGLTSPRQFIQSQLLDFWRFPGIGGIDQAFRDRVLRLTATLDGLVCLMPQVILQTKSLAWFQQYNPYLTQAMLDRVTALRTALATAGTNFPLATSWFIRGTGQPTLGDLLASATDPRLDTAYDQVDGDGRIATGLQNILAQPGIDMIQVHADVPNDARCVKWIMDKINADAPIVLADDFTQLTTVSLPPDSPPQGAISGPATTKSNGPNTNAANTAFPASCPAPVASKGGVPIYPPVHQMLPGMIAAPRQKLLPPPLKAK